MSGIENLLGQIHSRKSFGELIDAWDRFWFAARHVETLAVLRILTGAMLLYSHLVLATDLGSFLGIDAWINNDTSRALYDGTLGDATWAWSYLVNIDNPMGIAVHHLVTILVTAAFMVGFLTRITGPLAWWFQLMVIHRLLGSLFGLDQILTYCVMYLAFTPCGAVFSVDAWLRRRMEGNNGGMSSRRWTWLFPADTPSVAATVATRLLQIHLCVIYLFGGLAKARGQMWWDGTALWYAIGNYEYQSWDITFLAAWPSVFTAFTHLTLLWEISYCALIWPRWTRPIMLALAVAVHGGIALGLGMATFGLMMIIANGIFLSPWIFRRWRGLTPTSDEMERTGMERTGIKRTERESAPSTELEKRAAELEKGEEAFRKRYQKLKQREAKIEQRNDRIKATKAKLRQKLEDGTLVLGDKNLDASGIGIDEDDEQLDDNLSDFDLLSGDKDASSR